VIYQNGLNSAKLGNPNKQLWGPRAGVTASACGARTPAWAQPHRGPRHWLWPPAAPAAVPRPLRSPHLPAPLMPLPPLTAQPGPSAGTAFAVSGDAVWSAAQSARGGRAQVTGGEG